jgi:hypothetical protein
MMLASPQTREVLVVGGGMRQIAASIPSVTKVQVVLPCMAERLSNLVDGSA